MLITIGLIYNNYRNINALKLKNANQFLYQIIFLIKKIINLMGIYISKLLIILLMLT